MAAETGGNLATTATNTGSTSTVLGATGDAAATAGGTGTVSAKLRTVTDLLNQILTELGQKTEPANTQIVGDGTGPLTVDGTVAATQSGTWNITNVSGTVSLPTGAATAANQDGIIRDGTGDTTQANVAGGRLSVDPSFPTTASTSSVSVRCVNTAGNAFEACGGSGGSGGTSSTIGSAVPSTGTAVGFSDGTNMVMGRVITTAPGASDPGLVVRNISSTTVATGSAVPASGSFVVGTDGTNARALKTDTGGELQVDVLTIPSVTIGTFPDNEPINVSQMNGTAVSMGNGVSGTGTQRVTLASDSTGTVTVTQGTGTNLHVVCDSGCSSSAGFADNSAFTFGTTAINPIGGVLDDTATNAATENSAAVARITAQKALHMNLRNASGTEMGTSGSPLRVDPTGTTTQPVSGTVSITANSAVNVAQMNGVATTMGNGVSGTGVQRVTIASDSTGTVAVTQATASNLNAQVVGAVAHDSADAGNPIKIGCHARTTNRTAVADADRADIVCDDNGQLVVTHIAPRDRVVRSGVVTLTNTTETTLIAAGGAGVFRDLTYLKCTNNSATLVRVDLRDATAGTVIDSWALAASGGGFNLAWSVPYAQATANNNWTVQLSGSVTDVRCSAQAVEKN